MKHIVIDLEMNNIRPKDEVRKICTNEIIEIGAVLLDEHMQEISSFRTYVKPEYNDRIEMKIRKITGITDAKVANAPIFAEAFKMFTNWCLGIDDEMLIYAWSDSDYIQITKEIVLKKYVPSDHERKIIDTKWSDFQKEFDMQLGFEKQVSLSMALSMAGINFSGREHNALDDARNTAELLQLFKDKELFDRTLKKIEEFMKPKPLGSTLGNLFDFTMFELAEV